MGSMQALFDEHAPLALSRQRDLGERIGDWSWEFDMAAGTMTFSRPGFLGLGRKTVVTRCQVLGSESESSGTWLWAWANTRSGLPASLLRAAESLRARGAREGIAELVEPSIPLERWDGHRLAMIASGLHSVAGYYRGPYEGGALFVLLTGPELVTEVERPLLRFSTVLPEAIAAFALCDHRLAARGLARGLGLRVSAGPPLAVHGAEGALTLSFDEHGRLARIEGDVRA